VPAGKLGRQPAFASQSFGYVVLDGPVWVGPVGPDGGTPLTTPGSVGPGVASRVEPGEDRGDVGLDRRQITPDFLDLHSQIGPRHRLGAGSWRSRRGSPQDRRQAPQWLPGWARRRAATLAPLYSSCSRLISIKFFSIETLMDRFGGKQSHR
jgi:hypothetical protein